MRNSVNVALTSTEELRYAYLIEKGKNPWRLWKEETEEECEISATEAFCWLRKNRFMKDFRYA